MRRRRDVYLVGLTGGMGSGKSAVAAAFRAYGWPVIDADAIAREVVEPGEPALAELADRFGPQVLTPSGALDRPGLARVAFASDDARADLEAITHPRIGERVAQRLADLASEHTGPQPLIVVIDHPLLIESGQADRYEDLVVVIADEQTRLRRLVEQRGVDEDDARARIRTQTDDATRRALATHVIVNDGSLDDLAEAAAAVAARIEAAATADRS